MTPDGNVKVKDNMRNRFILTIPVILAFTLACGAIPTPTPGIQSQNETPTQSSLSRMIATAQAIPTSITDGLKFETETSVGISIARPADWERDAGTKDLPLIGFPVDYVVYFQAEPAKIQMMSILTLGIPYHFDSDREIIREVLGANEERIAETNLRVIEYANDVQVAGQPAQVLYYRLDDQRLGIPAFSIILAISTLDDRVVALQWASNENMQSQTIDLFLKTLPTIRLLPLN